jgi:hypothetical protein
MKRRKLAISRSILTDEQSVFVDFAVRHIGAGEHDGLVIAVALGGVVLPYVERVSATPTRPRMCLVCPQKADFVNVGIGLRCLRRPLP